MKISITDSKLCTVVLLEVGVGNFIATKLVGCS